MPTTEQIDRVLEFLPALKDGRNIDSTWVGGKTKRGVQTSPIEVHSVVVSQFLTALYENDFVVDFDWPSWQGEAEKFFGDPTRLTDADLQTLQKLLTTHVRKDRFCEGHFSSMISTGHLTAILTRLSELRKTALT